MPYSADPIAAPALAPEPEPDPEPAPEPAPESSRQVSDAAAAAPPHGIALVDKPAGRTSHDVVAWARKSLGTRKVGHAGTLDPMATGLLVLGVGHATRLLTYLVGEEKEYLATIRLGESTVSDDAEGELTAVAEPGAVAAASPALVAAGIAKLTGPISQVPSAVSAVKIDGVRAYKRVRDGEQVEIAQREVTIREFALLGRREATGVGGGAVVDLDVRVVCSSGTYIRALARDLGADLGTGGHLTQLRRTRVGPFHVDDAVGVERPLERSRLVPSAEVAARRFGALPLDEQEAIDLGHGKRISAPAVAPDGEGPFAGIGPDGRLVGLVGIFGSAAKSVLNFPVEDR